MQIKLYFILFYETLTNHCHNENLSGCVDLMIKKIKLKKSCKTKTKFYCYFFSDWKMSEKLKQTFTNGIYPENLKISIVGGGLVIFMNELSKNKF